MDGNDDWSGSMVFNIKVWTQRGDRKMNTKEDSDQAFFHFPRFAEERKTLDETLDCSTGKPN